MLSDLIESQILFLGPDRKSWFVRGEERDETLLIGNDKETARLLAECHNPFDAFRRQRSKVMYEKVVDRIQHHLANLEQKLIGPNAFVSKCHSAIAEADLVEEDRQNLLAYVDHLVTVH